jgi:hypothetical protein
LKKDKRLSGFLRAHTNSFRQSITFQCHFCFFV